MAHLDNIISRYKRMRSMRALEQVYGHQYALVGMGNHCTGNLLPVVQYLQLPLKYICCASERKAALIPQKYQGVRGTTSLQEILADEAVSGVFVATHPHAHFRIAGEVIKAGKSLFIEKPPCRDSTELGALIDTVKLYGSGHIVVGMQRRFAPATQILQKRLRKEGKHHYHYRYLTGLYPEGEALLDLFIHPLDYVTFLFGEAKMKSVEVLKNRAGGQTVLLVLEHREVTGVLELSTDYSWQYAQEQLTVSTDKGFYVMDSMESLHFTPRRPALLGIPLEKVVGGNASVACLYGRNGFIPTVGNNQIVSQGFFSEIETFADMVEGRCADTNAFGLESLRSTYALIDEIREKGGLKSKVERSKI